MNKKVVKNAFLFCVILTVVLLLFALKTNFRKELRNESLMEGNSLFETIRSNLNIKYKEIVKLYSEDDSNELPWWEDDVLRQCSKYYKPTDRTEAYPVAEESWVLKIHSSKIDEISWNENTVNASAANHCGYSSALRGNNQNVISYSVYGDKFEYYRGFPEILYDAKNLYPGWVVRLYMNPRGRQAFLCPLLLKYRNILDICDAHNLPAPLGNVTADGVDPHLWRMAPFGEPMVKRFNVRDADSKLTAREQAAVSEWVESKTLIHIMRDHPWHGAIMLAGMFGIYQPEETLPKFDKIRTAMFKRKALSDQQNLAQSFWKDYESSNCLQHDSYLCKMYRGNIKPFPTQRQQDGDYVGRPTYREKIRLEKTGITSCPQVCRPKDHQDWIYC